MRKYTKQRMNNSSNVWTLFKKSCTTLNVQKVNNWAQITHKSGIFQSAVCKAENAWALLQIFWQVLWCKKVWGVRMGQKFALLSSFWVKFVWLLSSGEKRWKKIVAETDLDQIQKLIFFYKHFLAFTKSTMNKSLVWSKKSLGVRRYYVYVARLVVAMTTNQTRWSLATMDWLKEF